MATGIKIVITADDKASVPLQNVATRFAMFQKNVAGSTATIGRGFSNIVAGASKMSRIVSGAGMAAKLGLAAMAAAAVVVGAKFEQSMANVASVAGANATQMRELSDTARYWGAQTAFSASQAAEGMYALASAGLEVSQIKAAIGGTLQYAGAAATDLGSATETVVQSLKMFGMEADQTNRVVNVLAAGISVSMLNAERLKESLAEAGTTANAAGMSFEQTVGILGMLHNAGMMGSVAGTNLKNVLVRLMSPNQAMRDLMGETAFTGKNLAEVMDNMRGKMTDVGLVYEAFGRIAAPAALVMMQAGADAMDEMTEKVTGTQKAFEMYQTQMNTVQSQFKVLKSGIEETFIATFTEMEPLIRSALRALIDGVSRIKPYIVGATIAMREWIIEHKDLIVKVAKFTAIGIAVLIVLKSLITIFTVLSGAIQIVTGVVQVLTGVVWLFGTVFIGILGFLFSPIGLLVAAIGGIIAIIVLSMTKWRDESKSAMENIKGGFKHAFEYIANAAKWVGGKLRAPIATALLWIYDKLLWLAEKGGAIVDKFVPGFTESVKALRESVGEDMAAAAAETAASWADAVEWTTGKFKWLADKGKSAFDLISERVKSTIANIKSMGTAASSIDLGGLTIGEIQSANPNTMTDEQKAQLEAAMAQIQQYADAQRATWMMSSEYAQHYTAEWIAATNDMIQDKYEQDYAAAGDNAVKIAEAQIELSRATMDAQIEYRNAVVDHYMATHQLQMAALAALESGFDEMFQSIFDAEMTWQERWESMVESMKWTFIRAIGEMVKNYIKQKLMAILVAQSAQDAADKKSRYSQAKLGAVAAYRAFASIPIIGPALGAAAAAAAFAFLMAFHKGGLVPGMASNERIVRVLPGEYIVEPAAVRSVGVKTLEYINATGQIPPAAPPGNTYVMQIPVPRYSPDELTERVRDEVVPVLERLFGAGAFRLEKV